MQRPRRALAQDRVFSSSSNPRFRKVLDHPLGELLAGIVRGMLSKEPAEQVAAARQGEADREHQVIAE